MPIDARETHPLSRRRLIVALDYVYLATETTTIRVTRETRDLLAQQARERGISLAAMLADLARAAAREVIFRSERDASRADADADDCDAAAEEHDWEATLGDGVG